MSQVKISQLPPLTAPSRFDSIPLVDSSVSTTKYIQMMYALTGATRIIAPSGYQGYADYYADGTADDVDIQAAMDAINALGGGELLIVEGTYNVHARMTLYANLTIRGRGAGKTVLKLTSDYTGGDVFQIGGNGGTSSGTTDPAGTYANISMFDFEVDCNAKSASIALYAPSVFRAERIYLHNTANYGFYIANANHVWIEDCNIQNSTATSTQAGIQFKGVLYGWVVNNYIYGWNGGSGTQGIDSHATDGTYARNGQYNHILGNYVEKCGQGINNEDYDTELLGNTVINTQGDGQYGIGLRTNASRIKIIDNIINGYKAGAIGTCSGISLFNITSGDDITISGNTIANINGNATSPGVFLAIATNVKFVNNTVYNCGGNGVTNRCARVVWNGNKFYDNQGVATQTVGLFNDTNGSIVGTDTVIDTTTGAGAVTTIKGQDATVGGSNLSGGELRLSSGLGTGNANQIITFYTSNPTSSGITTQGAGEKMRLFGGSNGQLVLGSTSITGNSGTNDGLTMGGNVARAFQMNRHTTSNTAGNQLIIASGGATSGATDKAAGDVVIQNGQSTGTGGGNITFKTPTPQSSTNTTDNTPSQKMQIDGKGNVAVGTAALATTATDGFLYIPTCAGVPTGIPTVKTGLVPMIYDTSNNNFYIYNGGWKKTSVFS